MKSAEDMVSQFEQELQKRFPELSDYASALETATDFLSCSLDAVQEDLARKEREDA